MGLPVTSEYAAGGIIAGQYTLTTDKFVHETETTFIVESELTLLQGHPHRQFRKSAKKPFVDTCNPSRYNMVELDLPDLNKELHPVLPGNMSMKTQFKVWKVEAIRIDIQGAIKPAITGACQTSLQKTDGGMTTGDWKEKQGDEEEEEESCEEVDGGTELTSPLGQEPYPPLPKPIPKEYWGFEHALRQRLIVGCKPPLGVYKDWDDSELLFERVSEELGDGDLGEFGYGNINTSLIGDQTYTPVEMRYQKDGFIPTYLLDTLAMDSDQVGDRSFICIERASTGVRHILRTYANSKEDPAWGEDKYYDTNHPDVIISATSGMTTLAGDIFNKNYWLHQSKNPNNGICFGNKLYITFQDNLRGEIDRYTQPGTESKTYVPFDYWLRHTKEFKVTVIVRECHIDLESAFINEMLRTNHSWLDNMGFNFGNGTDKPKVQPGQFHKISHEAPPIEEEMGDQAEEQIVLRKDKKYIQMSCNGQVRMMNAEHSTHTLAVSHRAIRPVKGEAVQVTAGRKATAKRKK